MINMNREILDDVMKGFQIPPRPEILKQIEHVLQGSEPDINTLADIISEDVGISLSILKTINSPFYGMNRTITDISQAVLILGIDTVTSLATSNKLKTAYEGKCCISLERFWDESSDVAHCMAYIGKQVKNNVPPEDLYSLGLFRDAGIPAMAFKYDDYVNVLVSSNSSSSKTLVQLEQELYPTHHAVTGYYLANSWNLPRPLCNLVLQHHEIDFLDRDESDSDKIQYSILKMAENIVGFNKNNRAIPEWTTIKEGVFDYLAIDESIYSDMADDILQMTL